MYENEWNDWGLKNDKDQLNAYAHKPVDLKVSKIKQTYAQLLQQWSNVIFTFSAVDVESLIVCWTMKGNSVVTMFFYE